MAVILNAYYQKLIDFGYIIMPKVDELCGGWLSARIWTFYETNTHHFRQFDRKSRLKRKLTSCLTKYFTINDLKFENLYISGSTVNGFATNDSDIDLCFVVHNFFYKDFSKSKKVDILSTIESIVSNEFEVVDSQVIEARVPILRYTDRLTGIRVEININNEIGIRNSRLLYCYSKLDWRVVPICISIKQWAKHYQIIDSFSGCLSSYCVELMAIFYLQICSPPLLPCLQKTDVQMFATNTDISEYRLLPDLEQLNPFKSENQQSLGQLFVGFFKYYSLDFDFSTQVASVRLGRTISKASYVPPLDQYLWEYIAVEEPFSLDNSARTLYELKPFLMVTNEFKKMYEKFKDLHCDCGCDY
ncbi:poly(A) RNA polymerase GLD2-like [Oppia nitens]|uniref:poly(A) RNA polymerase GLD2-like n=1 Tax=Oppia nitens TaxID=1686743 RepID=UPI0023DAA288|nr:poly(A) RNA polymerase GLD2-like [Oppia nitens]